MKSLRIALTDVKLTYRCLKSGVTDIFKTLQERVDKLNKSQNLLNLLNVKMETDTKSNV